MNRELKLRLLGECREQVGNAIGKAFIGYADCVVEDLKEELCHGANDRDTDLLIKGAIAGMRRYARAIETKRLVTPNDFSGVVLDGAYNP